MCTVGSDAVETYEEHDDVDEAVVDLLGSLSAVDLDMRGVRGGAAAVRTWLVTRSQDRQVGNTSVQVVW